MKKVSLCLSFLVLIVIGADQVDQRPEPTTGLATCMACHDGKRICCTPYFGGGAYCWEERCGQTAK